MKHLSFLLFLNLFLFLSEKNNAQSWEFQFEKDKQQDATDIIETSTGDFLILGKNATSSSSENTLVLKMNSLGEPIWDKVYDEIMGYKVRELSDGNFLLIGRKPNTHTNQYIIATVLKIDQNGNKLWEKDIKKEDIPLVRFTEVLQLPNSKLAFLSGEHTGRPEHTFHIIIVDEEGEITDDYSFSFTGMASEDILRIIDVFNYDENNGYLIAGNFKENANDAGPTHQYVYPFIVKIDLQGNKEWEQKFQFEPLEFSKIEQVYSLDTTGYVVLFKNSLGFNPERSSPHDELIFAQLNRFGDPIQSQKVAFSEIVGDEFGHDSHEIALKKTGDNQIFALIEGSFVDEKLTMAIGKIDLLSRDFNYRFLQWNCELVHFYEFIPTSDGRMAFAGTYKPQYSGPWHDFYILKTGVEDDWQPCNIINSSQDILIESTINIYPNPTKNDLNIFIPSFKNDLKYRSDIFNLKGQLIRSESIKDANHKLDGSELSSGTYIISISNENTQIYAQKFIVQD